MGRTNSGWTPTHGSNTPSPKKVPIYDEDGKLQTENITEDDDGKSVVNKNYTDDMVIDGGTF